MIDTLLKEKSLFVASGLQSMGSQIIRHKGVIGHTHTLKSINNLFSDNN